MRIEYSVRARRLGTPLRVSHTVVEQVQVTTLRIDAGGYQPDLLSSGLGECAVGLWTREDPDVVARTAAEATRTLVADAGGVVPAVDQIEAAVHSGAWARLSPTSRMLAEMALLDLAAKRAGQPLWQLLGLPEPVPVPLWRTISVGGSAAGGSIVGGGAYGANGAHGGSAGAGQAAGRRLKVKLGGPYDAMVLDSLAGVPGPVIVDVNRGWSGADLRAHTERLRRVNLAALEDPVVDPALLALVRAELPGVPILLDEGIRTLEQVEAAARHADGANVKLVKFGGLFAARRALERLGELGARRMLGCFVEPPRAIAYSALLAGQAEWADLDGHLFLDGIPGVGDSGPDGSGPDGWSAGMLILDSGVPGIPRVVDPVDRPQALDSP